MAVPLPTFFDKLSFSLPVLFAIWMGRALL